MVKAAHKWKLERFLRARQEPKAASGDPFFEVMNDSGQTGVLLNRVVSGQSTRLRHAFRPGELWLDNRGVHINAHGGGVLFHEGRYFWFGEHKTAGEAGNVAQVGVHAYSSRDLYNWTDEGIALEVSEDSRSPMARGCILERPKVLFNERTRQFVMWFHLEPKGVGYSGALCGVACAGRATGPYRLVNCFRPNAGVWPRNVPPPLAHELSKDELQALAAMDLPGAPRAYYPKHVLFRRDFGLGQMSRDMTLFADDDGRAYHIYASEDNGTLHISLLTEDYLRPAGQFVRVLAGRFNEAPAMMKWRGRYFLFASDCTGWAPNAARLLAADTILGDWEELGNPCLGQGDGVGTTFHSQPAFILPVADWKDAFIFMADRWNPANAIDGRYVWLPIEFRHGVPMISWREEWNLRVFDQPTS